MIFNYTVSPQNPEHAEILRRIYRREYWIEASLATSVASLISFVSCKIFDFPDGIETLCMGGVAITLAATHSLMFSLLSQYAQEDAHLGRLTLERRTITIILEGGTHDI